jgi:hypothetical protein
MAWQHQGVWVLLPCRNCKACPGWSKHVQLREQNEYCFRLLCKNIRMRKHNASQTKCHHNLDSGSGGDPACSLWGQPECLAGYRSGPAGNGFGLNAWSEAIRDVDSAAGDRAKPCRNAPGYAYTTATNTGPAAGYIHTASALGHTTAAHRNAQAGHPLASAGDTRQRCPNR